jgi:hypothetical protein
VPYIQKIISLMTEQIMNQWAYVKETGEIENNTR